MADHLGWNAPDNGIRLNVIRDDSPSGDNRTLADANSFQNRASHTQPNIIVDDDGCVASAENGAFGVVAARHQVHPMGY